MNQIDQEQRRMSPLRRVMLFSVGSLLIAEEQVKAFAERAIARGQEAQAQGKQLVQESRAERRTKSQARTTLETRISETMERLNVCSKQDIEALQQQVAELTQQLEALEETE